MEYILEHPVVASIGTEKYKCTVEWRNGKFISDEPAFAGGKDTGPDPYTLLLSSLGACTITTLRMYIDRKGWDVPQIAIAVNMYFKLEGEKRITVIDRDLNFLSPITDEQRERLVQIAKVCPVSKILEGGIQVRTFAYTGANAENTHSYTNGDVTVEWRPELCKHADNGCQGINFHTGIGLYYSPVMNENGVLKAKPEYYAMLAFKYGSINGRSISTKIDEAEYCSAHTSLTNGTYSLTIINKNLDKSFDFNIVRSKNISSIAVSRLTAPSITSAVDVTR